VQSIERWKVTGTGRPTYVSGATTARVVVNPGDFVLGDADAVIVIPATKVIEMLELAEALTRTDVYVTGVERMTALGLSVIS
jgi:regulator of RNase E activity RraA